MMRLPVLAALAALLLAPPLPAQDAPAEDAATEATARAAMAQLRSPVTPFHTLDMCPDLAAAALRDTLRMEAARGASVDEIVAGTIARRGEELRIVPKRSGVGLWAWIAPPAVLLGGLLVVGAWLRRSRAAAAVEPEPEALSGDDRERLAAALAEWEHEPGEAR
ncbi:MAG TPA: cytochrome c-type biogenesis protein CcmH [Longimicrobiaceae bacterium]|nr:cytochrome c-type biogenesis protein CcmH [Longimicrobiaceae bacterium]